MSENLSVYEYDTGDDVDALDVQRDLEEELEGTLMIMGFLFAPIIIGVLLAIFVCCRGYKPSQDVQIPMEAVSTETAGATSLGSSIPDIPDGSSSALQHNHQSTENQQNFSMSARFSELETVTCPKLTNASGRSRSCSTKF